MKKSVKKNFDINDFSKFRLNNPRAIVGGLGDGPIDPPKQPRDPRDPNPGPRD